METYERFEMMQSVEKTMNEPIMETVHSNVFDLGPPKDIENNQDDMSTASVHSVCVDSRSELPYSIASCRAQLSSDNNAISETHEISELNKTEWMCFICKETKQRDLRMFVFRSIKDLHTHWQSEHSADGPLKFYVVDLLSCNIDNCRYFSTFQGLWNHHKKRHPDENFVAIQDDRCSLCFFSGEHLSQHSCHQLSKVQTMKLFSPLLFTDKRVALLQSINRRFHCKHCGETFSTKDDVLRHHQNEHRY